MEVCAVHVLNSDVVEVPEGAASTTEENKHKYVRNGVDVLRCRNNSATIHIDVWNLTWVEKRTMEVTFEKR